MDDDFNIDEFKDEELGDLNINKENTSTDSSKPITKRDIKLATPSEIIAMYKEGKRDFSNYNVVPKDSTVAEVKDRKDFEGQDLRDIDLSNSKVMTMNFTNTILDNAKFDKSEVTDSLFKRASLKGTSFKEANVKNTDFSSAKLSSTDFTEADITLAKFNNCDITQGIFIDCVEEKIEGIPMTSAQILAEYTQGRRDFTGIRCPNAQLSGLNLKGIILRNSYLHYADFSSSDLTDADLSNCILTSVAFVNTTMRNTNLSRSNCYWTTFKKAHFENTNFRKANLIWTDLSGTDIGSAHIEGAELGFSLMENVNLGMNVVNMSPDLMRTIKHSSPSGAKILQPASAGHMTYGGGGAAGYASSVGASYGGRGGYAANTVDWEEEADPTKKLIKDRKKNTYASFGTYG
jgi:uncharacterized protein YjbI with pentapeptide repeats